MAPQLYFFVSIAFSFIAWGIEKVELRRHESLLILYFSH